MMSAAASASARTTSGTNKCQEMSGFDKRRIVWQHDGMYQKERLGVG